MKIFPLTIGQVSLNTNRKDFLKKLSSETASGFNLFRVKEKGDLKNNKAYESEFYNNFFMLRSNPIYDSKISPFIKTIIYGKIIEKDGRVIFRYWISFNVFTCIIFISIIISMIYSLYHSFFSVNQNAFKLMLISIVGYLIFIGIFNSDAKDDKYFIDGLFREDKYSEEDV